MIEPQIMIAVAVLVALAVVLLGAGAWAMRVHREALEQQAARERAVRVAVEHRKKHGPRYLKVVYGKGAAELLGSDDGNRYEPLTPAEHERFRATLEPAPACSGCGDPVDAIGYSLCRRCRDLEDAHSGGLE